MGLSLSNELFSKKQIEYVVNAKAKINMAHGAVRTGKTVGSLFAFLKDAYLCPGESIWMVGHTQETIYQNVIRLIFETPTFKTLSNFCSWSKGNHELTFGSKSIKTLGAKDDGAIGSFFGKTFDLCYCDEITLYPNAIIEMIDTRLSNPHSKMHCTMNPTYPDHIVKKWIDRAEIDPKNYYALQFFLDDNPFVDEAYKNRIKNSLTGVQLKRHYYGHWCLAEGAIFDFFDRDLHVLSRPPCAAEYWIAGVDFGMRNPTACVLIGCSTGRHTQTGRRWWVEKEYYWDQKQTGRQKTVKELAEDIQRFLRDYYVRAIYVDPSAVALKLELKRLGIHTVDANNEVKDGIEIMTSEMAMGRLSVLDDCPNLIKEIEGYVWDDKKAIRGIEEPIKVNDHATDALRYAVATHKISAVGEDPWGGRNLGRQF